MPNTTEFQPFDQNHTLRTNDKDARELLGHVVSRTALAVKVFTGPTNGSYLDFRYNTFIFTNAGAIAVSLHLATDWGTIRTPILFCVNAGAGLVTIAATGTDTINGAANYNLAVGAVVIIFSDGVANWYVK